MEVCEIKVKEFTISYSKAKTQIKRDKLQDLQLKLTKLEKDTCTTGKPRTSSWNN